MKFKGFVLIISINSVFKTFYCSRLCVKLSNLRSKGPIGDLCSFKYPNRKLCVILKNNRKRDNFFGLYKIIYECEICLDRTFVFMLVGFVVSFHLSTHIPTYLPIYSFIYLVTLVFTFASICSPLI